MQNIYCKSAITLCKNYAITVSSKTNYLAKSLNKNQ